MILGYTGPKNGMTHRQAETVRYLFNELGLRILHHGDCIGGDAQAHRLAKALAARVVIHPPVVSAFRALCHADEVWPEKPFLIRNADIAAEGVDGLIAALESRQERFRGSGTWATVRYARKAGRRVWKVWPDGTFECEDPQS